MKRWAPLLILLVACKAECTASSSCNDQGPTLSDAELEQGWREIEAWAEPLVAPGPSAELEQALAALERIPAARIDQLEEERTAGRAATLDPPTLEVVEHLVAWHAAGGGVPEQVPVEGIMPLFRTGRVALAAASAEHPERLRAAAYLGHRLISEGSSLLAVTVGSELAAEAAETAEQLGLEPGQPEVAASGRTLIRALAAEALTSAELARDLPPAQRRGLREFHVRLVRAAAAHEDDVDGMRQAVRGVLTGPRTAAAELFVFNPDVFDRLAESLGL